MVNTNVYKIIKQILHLDKVIHQNDEEGKSTTDVAADLLRFSNTSNHLELAEGTVSSVVNSCWWFGIEGFTTENYPTIVNVSWQRNTLLS